MADSKLSALPEVTTLADTDELYINDAGQPKRITKANLDDNIDIAASQVSVTDSGGNFTATDVEGVLTEIAANGVEIAANGVNFKNKIINGCMRIDQRGGVTGTTENFGLDRMKSGPGTGGTRTVTQQALTIAEMAQAGGCEFAHRFTQTVAGTSASSLLIQLIEGVKQFSGKTITVSFYARYIGTNAPFKLRYRQYNGSTGSGAPSDQFSAASFTPTTSFQRFSETITLSANSGTIDPSNDCLEINFIADSFGITPTVEITGWQVEFGDDVTDFEHRPLTVEEQLCYRYYYEMGSFLYAQTRFNSTSSLERLGEVNLPVKMRESSPTTSYDSASGWTGTVTLNATDSVFVVAGGASGATTSTFVENPTADAEL